MEVIMHFGTRTHGLLAIWAGLGLFMAMRAALGAARVLSGRGGWKAVWA